MPTWSKVKPVMKSSGAFDRHLSKLENMAKMLPPMALDRILVALRSATPPITIKISQRRAV